MRNFKDTIAKYSFQSCKYEKTRRNGIRRISTIHGNNMLLNLSMKNAYAQCGSFDYFSGLWFICKEIYAKEYGDLARITELCRYENSTPYKSIKEISARYE